MTLEMNTHATIRPIPLVRMFLKINLDTMVSFLSGDAAYAVGMDVILQSCGWGVGLLVVQKIHRETAW